MTAPNLWWRDGVIYQIYPRSFADSDHDGLGDLNGIRSRMKDLAELGVDAIWLSPIYPSPDADFGYDVRDYTAIDRRYGSLQDFDALVSEAHERNIRIIMDLVLNHTSELHPWFLASRSSRDNPKRDWYLWRDPAPGGKPPNNWRSIFGGSGWEFDEKTGQYYFHMFAKEQPDVNWRNPEVRQAMLDVFRFWLDRGVDGFRLDVFNAYFKQAELHSNPWKLGIMPYDHQHHLYDIDQPEMLPLLSEIRQLLESYPERYAVGETFLASSKTAARYCGPDLLHATFDFLFLKSRWKPRQFLKAIQEWDHNLSNDNWPNYVLNNHDVKRSATRYGQGESDERLKVAAALLLSQRGTPFLYYGEEIGMRDIKLSRKEIRDPVGKYYWPFYAGRDGCRAPMQWTGGANAGFSEAQPWLPIHSDYTFRNVAAQRADPDSLYNFYRRLIALRKQYPALISGMMQPLTFEPRSVLAYLRQTSDQIVLVVLNFSNRRVRFVLGSELMRSNWELLLSSKRDELPQIQDSMLPLLPNEAMILLQK